MIDSYNPVTGYKQRNWQGADSCTGECRPKNLAFIDAENVTVSGKERNRTRTRLDTIRYSL